MIPSWIVQADPGVSQETFLKSVVVITFFGLSNSISTGCSDLSRGFNINETVL
jgi:hypothetical protein